MFEAPLQNVCKLKSIQVCFSICISCSCFYNCYIVYPRGIFYCCCLGAAVAAKNKAKKPKKKPNEDDETWRPFGRPKVGEVAKQGNAVQDVSSLQI